MSRTNVDIDDEAGAEVMRRHRPATKREAVNFALRTVATEPLGIDEARRLRGSGTASHWRDHAIRAGGISARNTIDMQIATFGKEHEHHMLHAERAFDAGEEHPALHTL